MEDFNTNKKKNLIDIYTHMSTNIKILHIHETFMKININLSIKKILTF